MKFLCIIYHTFYYTQLWFIVTTEQTCNFHQSTHKWSVLVSMQYGNFKEIPRIWSIFYHFDSDHKSSIMLTAVSNYTTHKYAKIWQISISEFQCILIQTISSSWFLFYSSAINLTKHNKVLIPFTLITLYSVTIMKLHSKSDCIDLFLTRVPRNSVDLFKNSDNQDYNYWHYIMMVNVL